MRIEESKQELDLKIIIEIDQKIFFLDKIKNKKVFKRLKKLIQEM